MTSPLLSIDKPMHNEPVTFSRAMVDDRDELTGFVQRMLYALGPLGVGIILDVLDAATFGPIGVVSGSIVGGLAGWYLGKYEGLDRSLRIALAFSAAVYMTTPFTEAIPAATILVLLSRYFVGPRHGADDSVRPPRWSRPSRRAADSLSATR